MKSLIKLALIAFLMLLATPGAPAQDKGRVPSPPAKIEGRFVISDLGNERTVVALTHQKVGGENSCAIWVSAGYTYVGELQGTPERVYISFVRDSADEPKMLKSEIERTLVLLLDGESVKLGPMPSVKEVTTGYSLVTQGLMLHMPYETFRKVANARKVDVNLGPLKFSLTDGNLQDFRNLQARMKR